MIRNPRRAGRPLGRLGVTLTEVLVAMFVMAIGMISLLTLFPLGAMQVGQALRDDRATQLARQADAYLRQTWRTDVVTNNGNSEGYFWAMEDPYLALKYSTAASTAGGGSVMQFVGSNATPTQWYSFPAPLFIAPTTLGVAAAAPTNNPPTPFALNGDAVRTAPPGVTLSTGELFVQPAAGVTPGSSYPVLLDPSNLNSRPSTDVERGWVGKATPPTGIAAHPSLMRIPRRTCRIVNSNPAVVTPLVSAFELTNLIDDMAFNANGAPVGGSELGRQGRYSWAAVLQRPDNTSRFIADLSVLVFDKRPALPQAGDELVVVPDTAQLVGSRTVTITLPNRTGDTSPVLLKRGGWIVDGTVDSVSPFRRNFYAYRVSGFTEGTPGATTTTYDVDLETPLKADLTPNAGVGGGPPASQLYLFAGLIEVYTRPQLRPDSPY